MDYQITEKFQYKTMFEVLEKPTFSIIGTGFIFPRHIQAIQAVGGEIIEIVNEHTWWERMIAKTEAKYIVILTPNDLHFPMIKRTIERGKIVICEKPLVINQKDFNELCWDNENIFTILQLRHHPFVRQIIQESLLREYIKVNIDISVCRDRNYDESWKGDNKRSGGILYNLGIHYFDLLIYLLGLDNHKLENIKINDKEASGIIKSDRYTCNWHLSTKEAKERQRRIFYIDGKEYNFSSKDNLSQEDLHIPVYRDLMAGIGVHPFELKKLFNLLGEIKTYGNR